MKTTKSEKQTIIYSYIVIGNELYAQFSMNGELYYSDKESFVKTKEKNAGLIDYIERE